MSQKLRKKGSSLRSIVSVDTDNRITGVRELPDVVANVSVDKTAQQKIHSNFSLMEITRIDLGDLKQKIFYNLPATSLIGNALFQHISKFLYDGSSNLGTVLVTRAFKLRADKSYFCQVCADVSNYKRLPCNNTNY